MLGIFIFLVALLYSVRVSSLQYFSLFHFFVLLCILFLVCNNVEVAFQISSKPSDTKLYYDGFTIDYADIKTVLFYEYPLMLRIFVYPFHNVLYALFIQSTVIYFLLDLIIKNKQNLIFFVTLHALLFTSVNMFKDNLIIIVFLFAIVLLEYSTTQIVRILIIGFSFLYVMRVRPFFQFMLPFAFMPWFTSIKKIKVKILFLLALFAVLLIVMARNWVLISYVIQHWATDASIQNEKSSFPIALIKIFLGPAPRHYFYHAQYFEQPLLDAQGYFFSFLNTIYYFFLIYICIYVMRYFKYSFNIFSMTISRLYALSICCFLILVYGLAYGSADIRQRAIIITFFYVSILKEPHSSVFVPINRKYLFLFFLFFYILLYVTIRF